MTDDEPLTNTKHRVTIITTYEEIVEAETEEKATEIAFDNMYSVGGDYKITVAATEDEE